MPLSWNDIRSNALAFSREFRADTSEHAEAKTFWDQFFEVFGVSRRRVASFEKPVKKQDGKGGFIDLLWKGTLLVEHKSRGKDLDRAYHQATDYFHGLKERDLPRYVLVSDFARFRLYDLDDDKQLEFELKDLHRNVSEFGFIAGYEPHHIEAKEEAASIEAAEQLGELHDQLKAAGYVGHPLEVTLVRLLFCLFAEDTGIFEKNQFREYLEQRTSEDGSDLGMHLLRLFQTLDTPLNKRNRNLDEQVAAFTYVNGRLFEEALPIPEFTREMRETLLDGCGLTWSQISPAIFGSLFQSIMDEQHRRETGGHYTREVNILKALKPLFLDSLTEELKVIGTNQRRLVDFQKKLAAIRVLDPACGCGNFLVVAYRELRELELEVLRRLHKIGQSSRTLDIRSLVYVDVDQFYGIELEEFPAQIAQVAMWLTDHQMNMKVSEEFGQFFARLPLVKSANILHGNALTVDWAQLIPAVQLNYIVGNPPFIGAKYMSDAQRREAEAVFRETRNGGLLDYVSCWYRKAVDYMRSNPQVAAAFVSTSSIVQGEQVGILWPDLFHRGASIAFAHRTFKWTSEARGKAAVDCVIIGFGLHDVAEKYIFEYEAPDATPHARRVKTINAYLVDGPDVAIANRSTPLSQVPEIGIGNKPIDDGNYLFTPEEKDEFIAKEPNARKYFRRWIGSDEFLNGYERWCLWLGAASPEELRGMPMAMERVEAVRQFRRASKSAPTQKLADRPTRFHVENMPKETFVLIPKVSSERRTYIPMGFMDAKTLVSDLVFILPEGTLYHFGLLTSLMHMAWMRAVCGRLESRYRYSAGIVYNNFPWPEPTDKQRTVIEKASAEVLDARKRFPQATLADLYDPLAMPQELLRAHQELDRAVDAAYGRRDFKSEAERVAFLFERYQSLAAPLTAAAAARPRPSRGPRPR